MQALQVRAPALASSLSCSIGLPHNSQVPYVPSSIAAKLLSISSSLAVKASMVDVRSQKSTARSAKSF